MKQCSHAFVTYFDRNYLVKGLAMLTSLRCHEGEVQSYVICLDDETFRLLALLKIPQITPIRLSSIEKGDADLARAKGNRSNVEYYWTLTPTIIAKIMEQMAPDELLIYVDADLFFFSPVTPLLEELGDASVLIHKHNFPPQYARQAINGIFNVGLMIFRNDEEGNGVLAWWRERCIEWCYARCEDGKMGDQKYLESFAGLTKQLVVTSNIGAGVAPWNGIAYNCIKEENVPLVNGVPVIFFHFHATAMLAQGCIVPSTDLSYAWTMPMLEYFAKPYLEALDEALETVRQIDRGFSWGFKTSGLISEMCIVARAALSGAIMDDYPCQLPLGTDFIVGGSPQLAEYEQLCGETLQVGPLTWSGNYKDWQAAEVAASGYDNADILAKALYAAREVRDGRALWERDTVLFNKAEINWPLYASLMAVAAHECGKLHVLDFGGALGSTFIQHKPWLQTLPECSWHVVEQEHFVQVGQEEFSTETLQFHYSIEDVLNQIPINCILLSSVLQYLEKPFDLLRKLAKTEKTIIIDRTPMHARESRLTIQRVGEEIYKASYPCWWLDQRRVLTILHSQGYVTSPLFKSSVDPSGFWGVFAYRKRQ